MRCRSISTLVRSIWIPIVVIKTIDFELVLISNSIIYDIYTLTITKIGILYQGLNLFILIKKYII